MANGEVHVFASSDYPNDDEPPMLRPVIEDLYIWFSSTSAYVFGNGWKQWKIGMTIEQARNG